MAHTSENNKCPKCGSEKNTVYHGHSFGRSYAWSYRYCNRCDIIYKANYIKGCGEK